VSLRRVPGPDLWSVICDGCGATFGPVTVKSGILAAYQARAAGWVDGTRSRPGAYCTDCGGEL